MKEYHGAAAAPGKVLGKTLQLRPVLASSPAPLTKLPPAAEYQRLQHALERLSSDLTQHAAHANPEVAELLAAHQAILSDTTLHDHLRAAILQQAHSAQQAVASVFGEVEAQFAALDDPLFAARTADVRDLRAQLLAALEGHAPAAGTLEDLPRGTILLAHDLAPSQVLCLNPDHVVGIALAEGSPLAHSSILARSMGIVLICRLGAAILEIADGTPCLIDGERALLVVEPPEELSSHIEYIEHMQPEVAAESATLRHTADGVAIAVLANLNRTDDLPLLARYGVDGIGLLRSEFFFAHHAAPPTVEAQTALYAAALAALPAGTSCTVRAFDVGGDKSLPWLPQTETRLRGIRLLLHTPDILRDQFRALLRAALGSQVQMRLLLPMIALPDEIIAARQLLHEVAHAEGADKMQRIELGAMIELPSAALMAQEIAAHCDFLAIGSNDLAQFLFASDRSAYDAGALADGLHPAVLRTIAMVCQAAQRAARPVAICGELARNPAAAPLLIGLGARELSVSPAAVPLVKAVIGRYTLDQCRAIADAALAAPNLDAVQQLLKVGL